MIVDIKPKYLFFSAAMGIFMLTVFFSENNNQIFSQGEMGIIEIAMVLFYLFTAIVAIYLRIRENQLSIRWFLSLWIILSLIFLGEETNWGQEIFLFTSPQFFIDFNAQAETNFHNLIWLQGGKLLQITSEALWLEPLFKAQNIFRFFFVSYFLFLPVISQYNMDRGIVRKLSIPIRGKTLQIFIWMPIILSVFLAIFADLETRKFIAETRELHYALSIFIYVKSMGTFSPRLHISTSKLF